MNFLRNTFSSLISFFLIPLLFIYILAISVFGVLLSPSTVKTTLAKNNTYERLSGQIIPQILINTVSKNNSDSSIPSQVIDNMIAKVDKKVLATDLELVVNSVYDFVISDKSSFETKIDLTKYSQTLVNNLGPTLESYYNSLPICSPAQEVEILQNFSANIKCQSKDLTSKQYLEALQIEQIVNELSNNFPQALVITEKEISTVPQTEFLTNKETDSKSSILLNLQKTVREYRQGIQLLLISIISLSILLFATRLPNLASSSKWVSSALFTASLLPLIGSTLSLHFLKKEFFNEVINKALKIELDSGFQTSAVSLVSDNSFSFSQEVLRQMQFYSFIFIIIAIILYGIYFFLNHLANQKARKPLDEPLTQTHNVKQ